MWTKENRVRYNRDQLRYPSDVTEEEWGQLGALIPSARRGGRPRTVNLREVLNGLLYVLSGGGAVAGDADGPAPAQYDL